MIPGIRTGNLMFDCADAEVLCAFYAEMLHWERCILYGLPGVRSGEGEMYLFAQEPDYVPPVWPEKPGMQQKQIHIDYQVPDVAAAVAEAERLGAVKADEQYGGDDFVTMLDPAGHPFCLCCADNQP